MAWKELSRNLMIRAGNNFKNRAGTKGKAGVERGTGAKSTGCVIMAHGGIATGKTFNVNGASLLLTCPERHILEYESLKATKGSFRYWRFWRFSIGDTCQDYDLTKFVGAKHTPGGHSYSEYDSAADECPLDRLDVDIVSVRHRMVGGDVLLSEVLKTVRKHYAYQYYVGMFCRAGSPNDPRWQPAYDSCSTKCTDDHGGIMGLTQVMSERALKKI